MRRAAWTAALFSTMLVGCSARSATLETGTPAVHELARLQADGALDQDRLTCVIELARPAVQSLPEKLAHLRQARANREALAMSDHARSVQRGMHAGEAMDGAREEAATAIRHAASLESQGMREEAAQTRLWSSYSQRRAEELANIWVDGPDSRPIWSDEQAELLIEYADLMAASRAEPTGAAGAQRAERIQAIQATNPEVMEEYAALLLRLYSDPDVTCEPEG